VINLHALRSILAPTAMRRFLSSGNRENSVSQLFANRSQKAAMTCFSRLEKAFQGHSVNDNEFVSSIFSSQDKCFLIDKLMSKNSDLRYPGGGQTLVLDLKGEKMSLPVHSPSIQVKCVTLENKEERESWLSVERKVRSLNEEDEEFLREQLMEAVLGKQSDFILLGIMVSRQGLQH